MRQILFLSLIGLGGAAILLSLGIWQVQRLTWKNALIADIDARILAEPVGLPDMPDPTRDAYLPVALEGQFGNETLRVLVSQKEIGAGYRLITPFKTPQGTVLVDRGFVPVAVAKIDPPHGALRVIGNLQWPDETDSFTPAPDVSDNVWFARDVSEMAENLGTLPILVVAREVSVADGAVSPLPVDTTRIPNDHLQYAATWFSLAAIWLAMSITFLLRRRSQKFES